MNELIAVSALVVTNLAVVTALFLWIRSEANSDRRQMQDIQREDRKDLLQLTRNIESTIAAIQNEMKDFHRELLELKNRQGS